MREEQETITRLLPPIRVGAIVSVSADLQLQRCWPGSRHTSAGMLDDNYKAHAVVRRGGVEAKQNRVPD